MTHTLTHTAECASPHQYWSNLSPDGDNSAHALDELNNQLVGQVAVEMAEQRREMRTAEHVKHHHWTG